MKQQTAVEWLIKEINKLTGTTINPDEPIIEQAKQMEKEQMKIELPSDEEIEKLSKDVIVYNDTKRGWFNEGAKWMRDKIKQKQLITEIMQADEKDGLYDDDDDKSK